MTQPADMSRMFDDLEEAGKSELRKLGADELQRLRDALEPTTEEDRAKSQAFLDEEIRKKRDEAARKTAETSPPPPAEEKAKWEPAKDPYEPLPIMMAVAPMFYLWTVEAMEAGAYQYEVEEGRFETRYRPIDFLLVGRVGRPGDGPPCVAAWLVESCLASDRSGRIREAGRGRRVHIVCNQHMREILPMCDEKGAAHIRMTPLGWERMPDGTEDMAVDIRVETDPVNPGKIRLVSLDSVLGQGA